MSNRKQASRWVKMWRRTKCCQKEVNKALQMPLTPAPFTDTWVKNRCWRSLFILASPPQEERFSYFGVVHMECKECSLCKIPPFTHTHTHARVHTHTHTHIQWAIFHSVKARWKELLLLFFWDAYADTPIFVLISHALFALRSSCQFKIPGPLFYHTNSTS